MIKKTGVFLLAILLFTSPVVSHTAYSQDSEVENNSVTQGELALLLVNVLGLWPYLPASPSEHQAIEVMLDNGIMPAEGWQADKVVTRADLARIIVLALERGDEVEDPDNPQSWVDFLVGIGIPIDTVGVALQEVGPLGVPRAPNLLAMAITTDPMQRQTIFAQPDDHAMGTDMTFLVSMGEVIDIITVVDVAPPPPPVTPD